MRDYLNKREIHPIKFYQIYYEYLMYMTYWIYNNTYLNSKYNVIPKCYIFNWIHMLFYTKKLCPLAYLNLFYSNLYNNVNLSKGIAFKKINQKST